MTTDALTTISIAAGTGFFGWLFGKWKTPRERKKTDLQLINDAVSPLIDSIRQLTERNNEMVGKLIREQEEKLHLLEEKNEWIKERGELNAIIKKLEKEMASMNKKIETLLKK
jgi:chromosome segregation ATPase